MSSSLVYTIYFCPMIRIKPLYIKLFLSIIYAVGIVGLYVQPETFIPLTPLNLLLTAFLFLAYYPFKESNFIRYAIFIFVAGFAVELLGIQTGKLFGIYNYGSALGFKLKDVPLIIGLNWLVLVMATQSIAASISDNLFKSSLIGSSLMIVIDIFLEQVAPLYDFWSWHNSAVPLQNFVAWFIISFLFHGVGNSLQFEKKNPLALFIFILQLSFFVVLYILNILK